MRVEFVGKVSDISEPVTGKNGKAYVSARVTDKDGYYNTVSYDAGQHFLQAGVVYQFEAIARAFIVRREFESPRAFPSFQILEASALDFSGAEAPASDAPF